MNSRLFFQISLILIALLACDCTDHGIALSLEYSELQGLWNWTRSIGGESGGVWTPEMLHQRTMLEFNARGEYNTYTVLPSDSLFATGLYSVSHEGKSVYLRMKPTFTSYPDAHSVYRVEIDHLSGDTLLFHDLYFDGYQYTYVRLR